MALHPYRRGRSFPNSSRSGLQKLGLSEHIEWRGSRDQNEVIAALREADIFVLPSRIASDGDRDGLPNVLMEAASQELPILSTGVSSIPEFIENGKQGVLVEPDAEEIAAALARMIADPEGRARLAAAARKRLVESFGMDAGIDRLIDAAGSCARSPDEHDRLLRAHEAAGRSGPFGRSHHGASAACRDRREPASAKCSLVSRLRSRDGAGDPAAQDRILEAAELEIERLSAGPRPDLWLTYHSYYKAPDLLGPRLSRQWGIPYVLIEATRASKRLQGPYARFAKAAEAACDAADVIFYLTEYDREALERDRVPGQRLVRLRPFLAVEVAASLRSGIRDPTQFGYSPVRCSAPGTSWRATRRWRRRWLLCDRRPGR